jgi:hypothetical protein
MRPPVSYLDFGCDCYWNIMRDQVRNATLAQRRLELPTKWTSRAKQLENPVKFLNGFGGLRAKQDSRQKSSFNTYSGSLL